jgi:hypothetical protein
MTRAGTYPLSSIDRIQIYFNTKKRKSTKANLKKILVEEGGDIIMNAAIFLRNGDPCCHLKADGKVKCRPGGYNAWAISWNTPLDFAVEPAPNSKANYMACVKCIINRQKVTMDYQPDMNYKAPRTAVGTKEGRFAYYSTQDKLLPEALQDRLFEAGWDNAIMMDGGGSTCCVDKNGDGFVGDGRYIPFFIIVHLKAEVPSDNEPKGEKPVVEINVYSLVKDGNINLTKNFKVKEFACKDDSDPIFIARQLPMVCQYIRTRVGKSVKISSAYRTAAKNAVTPGAAEYSQHLYGTAADLLTPAGYTPKQLAAIAREIMPNWGGVGIYSWGIHVDVRETKADWNG